MSLKDYRSKRDLKKSHEPTTVQTKKSDSLHFCVQKHAARRLHYDFRLEYRGVLVSWAVPKGPSLNPEDKRLAVKVEDHPLDYQYFEGTIPKGQYGAGKVEIWDHGSYDIPDSETRLETEKRLEKGLKEGHFVIILNGEKLHGAFVFQKLKKDPEDTNWLLIKKEDSFASSQKPEEEDSSMRHMSVKKHVKMPEFIAPMLPTLIGRPFDSEEWLFEIKWDGYRVLAFINQRTVILKSRTEHLLNDRFPSIVDNLKKLDGQVIFDGEIVVLDPEGRSHFQLLQNYQKEKKGSLCYYVFDLLYKDGQDLRSLPLLERKRILKDYLKQSALPVILFSDHIVNDGEAFFKEASRRGLEGIVGKKVDSAYESRRSRDWVKIKVALRQEVVIGGFTPPKGSRQKFGALLVGVYDDKGELDYAGNVGGGFSEASLEEVYDQLKPLVQPKSPFKEQLPVKESVTWVKPKLVCEVSFQEWTADTRCDSRFFMGCGSIKFQSRSKKKFPPHFPSIAGKREARSHIWIRSIGQMKNILKGI